MIQIKIEVTCRIIMEVIYLAVKLRQSLFTEFFPLRKYLYKSLQFMYTISSKPFLCPSLI